MGIFIKIIPKITSEKKRDKKSKNKNKREPSKKVIFLEKSFEKPIDKGK